MTLAEIFVQLPPATGSYLEELLEQIQVPENPTREQVATAAHDIATELKFSIMDPAFNCDEKLLTLIEQLPEAITNELF